MNIKDLRRKANNLRKDAKRALEAGAKEYADVLLKEAVAVETVLVRQAAAVSAQEAGKELDKQRVAWSAELDKKLVLVGVGVGLTLAGLYIVTRRR